MIARVLLGFLLGALAGGIAFRLLPRASAGPAAAAPEESAAKVSNTAAAERGQEDSLATEIAALELSGAKLREEIRLISDAASRPAALKGTSAASLRAAFAARLGRHLRELASEGFLYTRDGQALSLDFQRWLSALCEETGLSPGEATFSPDGLWSVLADAFAAADPPFPAEGRELFLKRLEEHRKIWNACQRDRASMSGFELARESSGYVSDFYDAFDEWIPDDRDDEGYAYENFELAWPNMGPTSQFSGTRLVVKGSLVDAWSRDLDLGPDQRTRLESIVDDFMMKSIEAETALRLGTSGQENSENAQRRLAYDLMIAAQKQIADSMKLTDAQAKKLREWSNAYRFTVIQ